MTVHPLDAPASATVTPTLAGWLAHLENLHPKGQAGIELGLDRVRQVKAALGQSETCPVILVGGTNGKGSTCCYLEAILKKAGYRVGCYTSPHLLRYNERVRINGQPVSDTQLCQAFARVEAARGDVALTYFEFGTLAAWEVFAAEGLDAIVLEIGLGGRLDAVNVYEPDVSIITGIALDHMDWLGNSREAIGFEKAGIYREGKPALCSDPKPPQSLLDHAATIGADLRLLGRDFGFDRSPENRAQWRYWLRQGTQQQRRSLGYPGLRGATQLYNASAAITALECLKHRIPVPMQAIREGLIEAELPGRFQVLPGRPAIVLDVGHNPQAIAVLEDNLGGMGFFQNTYAILGMLADKDIAAAIAPLKGKVDHWFAASLAGPRGTLAEQLAEIIRASDVGGEVSCHESPAAALAAVQEIAGDNDRILAFGSFYTVAGVLHALGRG